MLLDFDRFLEEIYTKEDESLGKKRTLIKKKKTAQIRKIGKSLLNIRFK